MRRWYVFVWWAVIAGTVWGMFELFVGDFTRAYDVPFKIAILTAFGILVMAAGRTLVPRLGFATLAGAVACAYKFASAGFFPCQVMAVMIHAVTFDVVYELFARRVPLSVFRRMAAPVVFTALSFAVFGVFSLYVVPEPYWVERGWPGVAHYLYTSGAACALLGLATFGWGVRLGLMLQGARGLASSKASPAPAVWVTALALAGWGAGIVSALV